MIELSVSLLLWVFLLAVIPTDLRPAVLTAYVVRVALCYLHAYGIALPDSQFDAVAFERIAWLWAQDGNCFDDLTSGSRLYSWIGSCVYLVTGRIPIILQVINAFLGTMIVVVGMKTIGLVSNHRSHARGLGWMLALHPSLLLYSAITMRETLVVLTLMLSILWLVRWALSDAYINVVWSLMWMVTSQMFHTGMIVGTAVIVVIVVYRVVTRHLLGLTKVRIRLRDLKAVIVSLALASMLVVGGIVMLRSGYGLDKLQSLRTEHIVDVLADWQERSARGRASYLEGNAPRDLVGIAMQAPMRLVYFLASPFPWSISRLSDAWGFVDGVFMAGIFVLVVRNMRLRGRSVYLLVAVVVFALVLGFAMVTANYGTAFRHRAKFVPALVLLYWMGRGFVADVGADDGGVARKEGETAGAVGERASPRDASMRV